MTNTKTPWKAWEILYLTLDILIIISLVLFFLGITGMCLGWEFFEYIFLLSALGLLSASFFSHDETSNEVIIPMGIVSLATFLFFFLAEKGIIKLFS